MLKSATMWAHIHRELASRQRDWPRAVMHDGLERCRAGISMWAQRPPGASVGPVLLQEHHLKAMHVKWTLVKCAS